MAMPTDVGVIDLMLGIPEGSKKHWYGFLRAGLMDKESKDEFDFPVQYMFKEVPKDIDESKDPIATVLDEMDHFGIAEGDGGRQLRAEHQPRGGGEAPRPLLRQLRGQPEPGHGGRPRPGAGRRGARRARRRPPSPPA